MHPPEARAALLELISEGMSARAACREPGMPSFPTLKRWLSEDEEFQAQYAQAKALGIEAEAEALDDLQNEQPTLGPSGGVDAAWVAWRRLQVDTRKWVLSKKAPKKYGDKIDLAHSGKVQIERIECVVIDPKD